MGESEGETEVKLRPYQERIVDRGAAIIAEYRLLYLALETRTGKTFIALSIAHRMGARRVLFVTKLKAMSSVLSDFGKSGYGYEFDLLSVDSAHKIGGKYDLAIVDEAHCIGAFPRASRRSKLLRKALKGTPVIFLSATPTPESWSMLFHQLWVSPYSPYRHYRSFYAWARDYVTIKERRFGGVTVRDYSHADQARIQADLEPYTLTLTQAEADFNQEIQEHIMRVEVAPGIHALIKTLLKDRYYKLKNGGEIVCDTPVKLMSKCHQLASGTVIDEAGRAHALDRSKAAAIRARFSERKIAVFYKFVAEFDLLKEVFPRWTSSPETFRREPDTVFLGQFTSAREGLELSAAECIVFYNLDYAWLSYAQAKERMQARNRKTAPELWWVFGDTGIEEKIYGMVKKKRNYTSRWFMREFGNAQSHSHSPHIVDNRIFCRGANCR